MIFWWILKYHSRCLSQIPLETMLFPIHIPIYYTRVLKNCNFLLNFREIFFAISEFVAFRFRILLFFPLIFSDHSTESLLYWHVSYGWPNVAKFSNLTRTSIFNNLYLCSTKYICIQNFSFVFNNTHFLQPKLFLDVVNFLCKIKRVYSSFKFSFSVTVRPRDTTLLWSLFHFSS